MIETSNSNLTRKHSKPLETDSATSLSAKFWVDWYRQNLKILFFDFLTFFGRKSSKIDPRRRSGAKTRIFWKCWFYYSKTIIFEARDVPTRGNFGEKIASGASRGAGSNLETQKDHVSRKNDSKKRGGKKSEKRGDKTQVAQFPPRTLLR